MTPTCARVLIASTLFATLAGCEAQKKTDWPPPTNSVKVEKPTLADAVPIPSYQCQIDKFGNPLKAIVRVPETSIRDLDGNVIDSASMMDKLFVYPGGDEQHWAVSKDPRSKTALGMIQRKDVYITASMHLRELDQSTRPFRPAVEAFFSIEDVKKKLAGEPVGTLLQEAQIVGFEHDSAANNWMPVSGHQDLKLEQSSRTVRVLELIGWTFAASEESQEDIHEAPSEQYECSLVLVVDNSGSMTVFWKTLKEDLRQILMTALKDPIKARIAIVAYRDHDKGSGWPLKSSAFSDSPEQLQKWLSNLNPRAGGDDPELLFEGLKEAAKMLSSEPKHCFKAIIIATDAPGKFVDGKANKPYGDVADEALRSCIDNGISISAIQAPYHSKFKSDRHLLPQQLQYLASATMGKVVQAENERKKIASVFETWLQQEVEKPIRIENEIVSEMVKKKPLDALKTKYALPDAAFNWRFINAKRRNALHFSTQERLDVNGVNLGVEQLFVLDDDQAFRSGVLVRELEWNSLIAVLDKLSNDGLEKLENVVRLYEDIAGTHLGNEVTLAQALSFQGIPCKANGLLSYAPQDLVMLSRAQRLELCRQVEDRYQKLSEWRKNAMPDKNGNLVVPVEILP